MAGWASVSRRDRETADPSRSLVSRRRSTRSSTGRRRAAARAEPPHAGSTRARPPSACQRPSRRRGRAARCRSASSPGGRRSRPGGSRSRPRSGCRRRACTTGRRGGTRWGSRRSPPPRAEDDAVLVGRLHLVVHALHHGVRDLARRRAQRVGNRNRGGRLLRGRGDGARQAGQRHGENPRQQESRSHVSLRTRFHAPGRRASAPDRLPPRAQRLRRTLPLERSAQALGKRHLGLDAVSPRSGRDAPRCRRGGAGSGLPRAAADRDGARSAPSESPARPAARRARSRAGRSWGGRSTRASRSGWARGSRERW